MRFLSRGAFLVSSLAFLIASCRATAGSASPEHEGEGRSSSGSEKFGVLAPLDPQPIALWPEAHSGAWVVLEVVANGSAVKRGDVIARCETRAVDESCTGPGSSSPRPRSRTRASSSAGGSKRRARRRRWRAHGPASIGRSARSTAGSRRSSPSRTARTRSPSATRTRASRTRGRARPAREDVLRRRAGRRDRGHRAQALAPRAGAHPGPERVLSRDRAAYHQDLELGLQTEQREEEFRAQTESVARLERLRRDRALFELAAPCDGILLHGSADDYRPGKTPARVQRGSALAPRTVLFLVAPPAPGAVAFDVGEGEVPSYQDGAKVAVQPAGGGRHERDREARQYARTLGTSAGPSRPCDARGSRSRARATEARAHRARGEAVAREPRRERRPRAPRPGAPAGPHRARSPVPTRSRSGRGARDARARARRGRRLLVAPEPGGSFGTHESPRPVGSSRRCPAPRRRSGRDDGAVRDRTARVRRRPPMPRPSAPSSTSSAPARSSARAASALTCGPSATRCRPCPRSSCAIRARRAPPSCAPPARSSSTSSGATRRSTAAGAISPSGPCRRCSRRRPR
jgi:hypothetical protein